MIINIGRQIGSGGREIGEKLAAELDYAYYDKELLRIAAQQSGIHPELFSQADENSQRKFAGYCLWGVHMPYSNGMMPFSTGLDNDSLFRIQSDTIRHLAEQGNCVFVGRCADYILRERNDCFNIFISAEPHERIARIMNYEGISMSKATERMETTDKERAGYYNFYSGKNWGVASSYHLCINASLLGIDGTVRLLKTIVNKLENS